MSCSSSPRLTNTDDILDDNQQQQQDGCDDNVISNDGNDDDDGPDPDFIDVQITEVVRAQIQLPRASSPSSISRTDNDHIPNTRIVDNVNDNAIENEDENENPPLSPTLQVIADSAAETLVGTAAALIAPRIAGRPGQQHQHQHQHQHQQLSSHSRERERTLPALPEEVYLHGHGNGNGNGSGRHRHSDGGGLPQMREIQGGASTSRIRIVDAQLPDRDRDRDRERRRQSTGGMYRQDSYTNRSFREAPIGIVEGERVFSTSKEQSHPRVGHDIDTFVPVLQQSPTHSHHNHVHDHKSEASPRQTTSDERDGNGGGRRREPNGGWAVDETERVDRRDRLNRRYPSRRTSLGTARSVEDRIASTLAHAREECAKFRIKSRSTGIALNVAIGLQVFVSALITGLSASKRGGFGVAILGGIGTIIASYLARARGSNEPELSTSRVKDLERFIRDCEAFIEDHGDEEPDKHTNAKIDDLRSQFEELLGNGDGQRKLSTPV